MDGLDVARIKRLDNGPDGVGPLLEGVRARVVLPLEADRDLLRRRKIQQPRPPDPGRVELGKSRDNRFMCRAAADATREETSLSERRKTREASHVV